MEVGRAPAEFNRGFKNHDGGGAVDVVITVDQNVFLALDGRIEPVDGSFHSGHQVGRVQMGEGWGQKTFGSLAVVDSSHDQKTSQSRSQLGSFEAEPGLLKQRCGEKLDWGCVGGFGNPSHESPLVAPPSQRLSCGHLARITRDANARMSPKAAPPFNTVCRRPDRARRWEIQRNHPPFRGCFDSARTTAWRLRKPS